MHDVVDGFTPLVARALEQAQDHARAGGADAVHAEHLMAGLVAVAPVRVEALLGSPVDPPYVESRVYVYGKAEPRRGPLPLALGAVAVLEAAVEAAGEHGAYEVEIGHLLLAALEVAPDAAARVLFDAPGHARRVREALRGDAR